MVRHQLIGDKVSWGMTPSSSRTCCEFVLRSVLWNLLAIPDCELERL